MTDNELKELVASLAIEQKEAYRRQKKDKTAYGILAAVDLSAEMRERILQASFYVARIHEQVFELDVPANCRAKPF